MPPRCCGRRFSLRCVNWEHHLAATVVRHDRTTPSRFVFGCSARLSWRRTLQHCTTCHGGAYERFRHVGEAYSAAVRSVGAGMRATDINDLANWYRPSPQLEGIIPDNKSHEVRHFRPPRQLAVRPGGSTWAPLRCSVVRNVTTCPATLFVLSEIMSSPRIENFSLARFGKSEV